jgi:hypothetical protein
MRRPTGVTILAIIAVIVGVLGLVSPIFMIFMGGLSALVGPGAGMDLALEALRSLIAPALTLAAGLGAMSLKPWAWLLMVISQVIALLSNLLELGQRGLNNVYLIDIVVAAAILFYLFKQDVRRAFVRAS